MSKGVGWKAIFKKPSKNSVHFDEAVTREHVELLLKDYVHICNDFALSVEPDLEQATLEFKELFADPTFLKLFQTEVGRGYMIGVWEMSESEGGTYEESYDDI